MTAVAPPPASLPSGPNMVSKPEPMSAPPSRRTSADSKPNVTVSHPDDSQDGDKNKGSPSKAAPLGPPAQPESEGGNPSRPPIRPNSSARSKFDLEPNVFEASFSRGSQSDVSEKDRASPPRGTDATAIKHNALPPLSSLTSPAAADPTQFPWLSHSLRSGPLSPAMLAGPANGGAALKPDVPAPSEGAFDPTTFRTGFTPGTGSGLTPGYNALMNGNFGALPLPSPNTAAFLNSITNATPLNEGADPMHAHGHPGQNGVHHHPDPHLHPPSAIPPHLQPPVMNPLGPPGPPQPTITPNTLNALTGVINDMNRANSGVPPPGGAALPQFYTPAMHPGAPHGIPPPGVQPPVDYAQQSANAASQAANGLFLLSQAHQELSKREEESKTSTPLMNKRTSVGAVPPGSGKPPAAAPPVPASGQKRKSDASNAAGTPKGGKRGKKNAANDSATNISPPKPAEMSPDEDSDDELDDGEGGDRKPETEEEKRKNFLERNRQAALKCRQRKKQWLQELQNKVETLTMDNDRLQQTVQGLHEEVNRLTGILMQHRDCGLGMPVPAYGRPLR